MWIKYTVTMANDSYVVVDQRSFIPFTNYGWNCKESITVSGTVVIIWWKNSRGKEMSFQ